LAICPFISACERKVGFDFYRDVCSNVTVDAYKDCDHYKELIEEERTPVEWGRLLAPR